jgi:hypothetical protein
LYGLGGIGKTQLAVNLCIKHQDAFDSVLFADGSSRESLLKSYSLFYRRLNAMAAESGHDAPDAKSLSPEQCCDNLMQWLALKANKKWLLIIDNVDKEPAEDGGFEVQNFFPPGNHGSILITTRLMALSRMGMSVKVDRMSQDERLTSLTSMLRMIWKVQRQAIVSCRGRRLPCSGNSTACLWQFLRPAASFTP